MKITIKIFPIIAVIFILISSVSYAQKTLEGYIFDETGKNPLSYAAILIGDTGVYTTSNEDGKFEIILKKNIDSLEIRYLGYKTTKVSTDYFRLKKILRLVPFSTILDEVIVSSKRKNLLKKSDRASSKIVEQGSYKMLYALIKKYRENKEIVNSKAYFTLNSKAYLPSRSKIDTIPLEQIEGFYIGKQELSKGILDLELKTGRFGQNSAFPFYSLDHISLLQNFRLFKKNQQLLPQHPGNMSFARIKKRYNVELQKTENYNGAIIHFQPKRKRRDIFSGRIFFHENDSIIEKIELYITNPTSFRANSIVKGDLVSIKNLKLNISFNPIDLNKIQYYDFNLDMVYHSGTVKSDITSKIILYLYDYNAPFSKPYFTNTIDFENDYDRLVTLPASDKIWKQNYPYPRSNSNTETTNFFKKENQFYSYYVNKLPSYSRANINISSIAWSNQKKLLPSDLKVGLGVKLNFYYALNSYENKTGSFDYIVKTLFDVKTSFFRSEISLEELDCINLAFDIYELNRHYLLDKIKESMTLEEVKTLSDKVILDARKMVSLMFKESEFGIQKGKFNQWKDKVHNELEKYNKR